MKIFTIGYGGRSREEMINLLQSKGVRTLVDVRLRPDRASMGIWVKAKTADKGIEKTLADAGIGYRSLIELGNIFLEFENWQDLYRQLLETSGELLTHRLSDLPQPVCLMCAEKLVSQCHRQQITEYLANNKGAKVQHL